MMVVNDPLIRHSFLGVVGILGVVLDFHDCFAPQKVGKNEHPTCCHFSYMHFLEFLDGDSALLTKINSPEKFGAIPPKWLYINLRCSPRNEKHQIIWTCHLNFQQIENSTFHDPKRLKLWRASEVVALPQKTADKNSVARGSMYGCNVETNAKMTFRCTDWFVVIL